MTLELNDNPGDGISGSAMWDRLDWDGGERPVQYVALCRGGGGHHRDNLIVDAVDLAVPFGFDASVGASAGPGC